MLLDIPCAITTGNVQTSRKTSYDSKTGWAPIRCVLWRSFREEKFVYQCRAPEKCFIWKQRPVRMVLLVFQGKSYGWPARVEPQTVIYRFLCQWGFGWVPQWVMRWVWSCVMGHAMGGVMCVKGHDMGGVHVFVGHDMGGIMHGVTHLTMGPPILGRVPYVQKSLLDNSEPPKRGWKNGAARKLSKSVENLFDTFWRFLTFLPCAKIVEILFDTFWRFLTLFDVAPFRRPFFATANVRQGFCGWPGRVNHMDQGGRKS